MDRLGPIDALGHRRDAYTDWNVTWSYPYSTTSDKWATGPVKVKIEITFIFPQWSTSTDAPQDLVDKWDTYIAALQLHENGHKEIAIDAGYEILQTIAGLPAYSSCSKLEQAADAAGESVLEQYRQQEIIYDQNTGHGATQGVRFP